MQFHGIKDSWFNTTPSSATWFGMRVQKPLLIVSNAVWEHSQQARATATTTKRSRNGKENNLFMPFLGLRCGSKQQDQAANYLTIRIHHMIVQHSSTVSTRAFTLDLSKQRHFGVQAECVICLGVRDEVGCTENVLPQVIHAIAIYCQKARLVFCWLQIHSTFYLWLKWKLLKDPKDMHIPMSLWNRECSCFTWAVDRPLMIAAYWACSKIENERFKSPFLTGDILIFCRPTMTCLNCSQSLGWISISVG